MMFGVFCGATAILKTRFDTLIKMAESKGDSDVVQDVRGRIPNLLFLVERSKNRNVVVYEANMEGSNLNSGDPVRVYWIMYEKSGNPTEDLNFLERRSAYGITVQAGEQEGHFIVTLPSFSRPIEVYIDENGVAVAVTQVNEGRAKLDRIYIKATDGWGLPKVEYVDVFARNIEDDSEIHERIIP